MSLGFNVNALLPKARGGGQLRMGLNRLSEDEWLQPCPDLSMRHEGFAAFPDGLQVMPEAQAPGEELASMVGVSGSLPEAALATHEDMCLLTRSDGEEVYRLIGAAVAWPSDWRPKNKIGLPLRALHAPIAGYEEQLASGVDRFMDTLKPGAIYGRCNWFIAPTDEGCWLADEPLAKTYAHVTPQNAGNTLFVRSERQTLRRLPESGAIVFTIGIYVEPLSMLNRANLARLSDAIESLPERESARRGVMSYAAQLKAYASSALRRT